MPQFSRQDYDLCRLRFTAQLEHAQRCIQAFGVHTSSTTASPRAALAEEAASLRRLLIALDDVFDTSRWTDADWASYAITQSNVD